MSSVRVEGFEVGEESTYRPPMYARCSTCCKWDMGCPCWDGRAERSGVVGDDLDGVGGAPVVAGLLVVVAGVLLMGLIAAA